MAHVVCNKCGFKKDNISNEHIGKKTKCPKCKNIILVKRKVKNIRNAKYRPTDNNSVVREPNDAPKEKEPEIDGSSHGIPDKLESQQTDKLANKKSNASHDNKRTTAIFSSEFSLRDHFKAVNWIKTYQLNLIRCSAALIIPFIIIFFDLIVNFGEYSQRLGLQKIFLTLILFGVHLIFSPISMVLFAIIMKWLSRMRVPFTGLITLLCCLPLVLLGDPIVFFIHKYKPNIIPLKEYSFFNFAIAIFVLDGGISKDIVAQAQSTLK